jgi:dihydrolipoamide dehydrogenase
VAAEDTGGFWASTSSAHAAELIHEAVVAMQAEATVEDLVRAVHVHPTLAEVVHEAAAAAGGIAVHAAKKA